MAGPYSIGSDHCPGLSKLNEEAAEVIQVIGKAMGVGGLIEHWEGTHLRERLEDELGDLQAAISFVTSHNSLDRERIYKRVVAKLLQFEEWHKAGDPPPVK